MAHTNTIYPALEDLLWQPDISRSEPYPPQLFSRRARNIPYVNSANALQTLDICIPASRLDHSQLPKQRQTADSLASKNEDLWIVYIHGGAWRDPKVDCKSFGPTQLILLEWIAAAAKVKSESAFAPGPGSGTIPQEQRRALNHIAGLASINYSLSPHPDYPTDSNDLSRNAKHPQHIFDILSALAYLQHLFKFGSRYILVGHSCGATLAMQTVMSHRHLWSNEQASRIPHVEKPICVLGVNGLYELRKLVHHSGTKHACHTAIYSTFLASAFGADDAIWAQVSPAGSSDYIFQGGDMSLVLLARSKEDTLVPNDQAEMMEKTLLDTRRFSWGSLDCRGRNARTVRIVEINGDHDEVWEKGVQLAKLIRSAVEELMGTLLRENVHHDKIALGRPALHTAT